MIIVLFSQDNYHVLPPFIDLGSQRCLLVLAVLVRLVGCFGIAFSGWWHTVYLVDWHGPAWPGLAWHCIRLHHVWSKVRWFCVVLLLLYFSCSCVLLLRFCCFFRFGRLPFFGVSTNCLRSNARACVSLAFFHSFLSFRFTSTFIKYKLLFPTNDVTVKFIWIKFTQW